MSEFQLRRERFDDHEDVRDIYERAFPTSVEADVVETLRLAGALRLALAVVVRGEMVGHIAYSPVVVTGPEGRWPALGLGPMAVFPEWQNKGIGTALVNESLRQLAGLGDDVVFVLGHPAYYQRFGFVPAGPRGLRWNHPCPEPAFMVKELFEGALDGRTGVVKYLSAFDGA